MINNIHKIQALSGILNRPMWESKITLPNREYKTSAKNKSGTSRSAGTGAGADYEEPEPDGEFETNDSEDQKSVARAKKKYKKDKEKEDADREELPEDINPLWEALAILVERTLTALQAVDILNLPTKWSSTELKKAYKRAAFAHHPDRGGDPDKIVDVIAAYQLLKKAPLSQGNSGYTDTYSNKASQPTSHADPGTPSGEDSNRFTKKHMIAAIKQKLRGGVRSSGKIVTASVPVGSYVLHLLRVTKNRRAFWKVSYVQHLVGGKWETVTNNYSGSMGKESKKLVDFLLKTQKKKWKTPASLLKTTKFQIGAIEESEKFCCVSCANGGKCKNKGETDNMSIKNEMNGLLEARKKLSNKQHYDMVMSRGKRTPFDRTEYPAIRGMEGPYRYKSGHVLYYDPQEGKYYDKHADRYLTTKEAVKLTM